MKRPPVLAPALVPIRGGRAVNAGKFFSMWFEHLMLPPGEAEQRWLTAWPPEKTGP